MEITITKDDRVIAMGFVEESLELLDDIEERILEMEANFNIESVNDIFRAVHTIKGTSSFLALTPIKNLSHELEFLLDDLRKGKKELNQEIVDILLKGTDYLKNLILSIKEKIDTSDDEVVVEIEVEENFLRKIEEVREGKTSLTEEKEEKPVEIEKVEDKETEDISKLKNAEISDEMLSQYKDEAKEHLDNIENHLLKLESNPDDNESINEVFRSLHSLKGNSGLLISLIDQNTYEYHLLNYIKEVAHKGESMLQKVRDGELRVSPLIVTLLFKALDYMNMVFEKIVNRFNREKVQTPQQILNELTNQKISEEPTKTEKAEDEGDNTYNPVKEAINQFVDVAKRIIDEWEKNGDYKDKDLATFKRILNLLKTSLIDFSDEEIKKSINTVEETLSFIENGKFNLKDGIATGILKDKIKYFEEYGEKIGGTQKGEGEVKKLGEILIESGKIKEDDLKKALYVQKKQIENKKTEYKASSPSISIESIRVRMDKLDKLMNDIGELVISKNSFYHIYTKLIQANVVDIAKEFKEKMIMKIGRLAENLQNTIVQVRMIPVRTVFQKFPRMVRDLALKNGKKIRLVMEGEDTELDKTVIEKLSDPLVHIIRNSCDHGIETPEERIKNNKDETGTILLKAEKKGNNVIIMIIDDGRGMDVEKIKRKAVERGLISEVEAEKMSKSEAINLIFMPGFSTAEKVTEVSGRGVGMDVVKTNITKLKGSIEIETEKGLGTTIVIKLPLTLAITKGLSFKLGEEYYIVPLESVEEIIKIERGKIKTFKERKIVNIRGEVIELIDLKKLYSIRSKEITNHQDEINVIIVKDMGIKFGLIVDSLEDELDMVVKPLPQYLSEIPGIGGSTILGNGMVAIVLEPVELLSLLNKN